MANNFKDQIRNYQAQYSNFKQFGDIIERIITPLVREVVPDTLIKVHIKTVAEYAEEPTNEIAITPDTCSITIIVATFEEVGLIRDVFKKNFRIRKIEQNLQTNDPIEDKLRLNRYVVELLSEKSNYTKYGVNLQEPMLEYKFGLNILTYIQQNYSVFSLARLRKRKMGIPSQFESKENQIAIRLEETGNSINDFIRDVKDYEMHYKYKDTTKILEEISRLKDLFDIDNTNIDVAFRVGRLAAMVWDWKTVLFVYSQIISNVKNFEKATESIRAAILRDLGLAKTKLNPVGSDEFNAGIKHLKDSTVLNSRDSDAFASLGGGYRKQSQEEKDPIKCKELEKKSQDQYREALKVNPSDPYALGNFLIYEIKKNNNFEPVLANSTSIEQAIQKRKNQVELSVDLPWSYFDLGQFYLLQSNFDPDQFHQCIWHYLLAIKTSEDPSYIVAHLNVLNQLEMIGELLCPNLGLVKWLLKLAIITHPLAAQKLKPTYIQKLKEDLKPFAKNTIDSTKPLFIFVGGTALPRKALVDSFNDLNCTIICRGIKTGIYGIAGDLTAKYGKDRIRSIGYHPKDFPFKASLDTRCELCETLGTDFSIQELLQYWTDIVISEIEPRNIKVLSISGDFINALEIRMAILFGTQVGIVSSSGGACGDIIRNPSWNLILQSKTEGCEPQDNSGKHIIKILYQDLEWNPTVIHRFFTRPFISDPDIENIIKVMIVGAGGCSIYDKQFIVDIVLDTNLIAGFLEAFDNFGTQLKIGNVFSVKFKDMFISKGFLSIEPIKIGFFLVKYPSESLERKIIEFIKLLELRLKAQLKASSDSGKVLEEDKIMAEIYIETFGREIEKIL